MKARRLSNAGPKTDLGVTTNGSPFALWKRDIVRDASWTDLPLDEPVSLAPPSRPEMPWNIVVVMALDYQAASDPISQCIIPLGE